MRLHLVRLIVSSSLLVGMCAAPASAQNKPGRAGRPAPPAAGAPAEPGVSPGDVQRMFDAYALMQAQEQLKISDEKFAQFLTRYKALQEVRRKNLQEHGRLLVDMRQMLNTPTPDESQLKDKMKALQDLEARSITDVRKAVDAIDQVLDVKQQAKFRVFEEAMERRKLELVTRARQANRAKAQKTPPTQ
jgi:3-oxoacyl-ACP reductase-like protein